MGICYSFPLSGFLNSRSGKRSMLFMSALKRLSSILPPHGKRVKVMEEEWDYLIILDACRYDYFKRLNELNGNLEKRISAGSHTNEWVDENFSKEYFFDIVYVSGNPQLSRVMLKKRLGHVPFAVLDEVWDYGWDKELNATPPSAVTQAAIKNVQKYKDDRMIIHYLQPHHPFLKGPRGEGTGRIQSLGADEINVYQLLEEGQFKPKQVRRGYEENVKIVLSEVKKLVKNGCLRGKIVVTADHGECLGEFGLWCHQPGVHLKPLVEIPWLEVKPDDKR